MAPRKKNFYICTISAFPNLLYKEEFSLIKLNQTPVEFITSSIRDIMNFETSCLAENITLKFRDLNFRENIYLTGSITRSKNTKIREDDGEHITETFLQDHPSVAFLVNIKKQLIYLEKNSKYSIGLTPKSLTDCLGNIFTNILSKQFTVLVKQLPIRGRFWDIINESKHIKNIEFKYLAPNIAGRTRDEMRAALKEMQQKRNITDYSEKLSNENSELKIIKDNTLDAKVQTVEMQGGQWTIVSEKGRIKSSDKYETINADDLDTTFGYNIISKL
ncbi:Tub family protein [Maridesulfovibrio ferrireducens]|uniref:Tub family protein n=1 Tax=Maridesulfovibrio ferrireducens TaxID=246191 RepID=A0A1G9HBU4_9BACT|nr:hypothetical protein [Maridesulfovibrio ferrireducens]SDL10491.1 Tub family protein [Maridesulfovibrio ferrireducens]